MTGRGIDQVLPFPSDPVLYESCVRDARDYVLLAEEENGPIPRPVSFSYVWGETLEELERLAPDLRIVNLETSITTSGRPWPQKGINYRMHPGNVPCLSAARIDACCLANNHVLDWDYAGLVETLDALRKAGIATAGAGRNREEAETPAVLETAGAGRCLVFAFGSITSGVPADWAAGDDKPGVAMLDRPRAAFVSRLAGLVKAVRRPGDIVVASIHWGSNWGYEIPEEQRELAHRLIEEAGVDLVHGHSSHHPKGIEVYRGKLVLYGCGDLLTDYEGIHGYREFRGELSLMYFPSLDCATGALTRLLMRPTRLRRLRLERASESDARWLMEMLNNEGRRLGTEATRRDDGLLSLSWT